MDDAGSTHAARISGAEDILGHIFKDRGLLVESLTHPSARGSRATVDNARLAFLGDAVIGLYVAEQAYRENPPAAKGQLTDIRKTKVAEGPLAGIARRHGLEKLLSLGQGEEPAGRNKASILCSLVEALIGAVYLDAGHDKTWQVLERLLAAD